MVPRFSYKETSAVIENTIRRRFRLFCPNYPMLKGLPQTVTYPIDDDVYTFA